MSQKLIPTAVMLIALTFVHSQSSQLTPQIGRTTNVGEITIQAQARTQQRINRYFHDTIVAKLKRCWGGEPGKGAITFKYTYRKTGTNWAFDHLETAQATLPRGQARVAEACMSDAVRGTTFSVQADEVNQDTFTLNWTWPVPLPANATHLIGAMFTAKPTSGGTGSGGCDGWGTPPSCYTCKGLRCEMVCVGSTECKSVVIGTGTSCAGTGKCASGGPFGVSGGSRVIY